MELLATMTLQSDTGLPADNFVNTFAIDSVGAYDWPTIAGAIMNFYNAIPTGGLVRIADLLSPTIQQGGFHTIRLYDISGHLDGSPHGSPIEELTGVDVQAGASGFQGLPSEVAFAVTLNAIGREDAPVEVPDGADPGSEVDRPKQRHTGKVYLGPLNINCLSTVDGVVRPASNIRDTARLAFQDMQEALNNGPDIHDLSVWSRKDQLLRRVTSVSTDNAFDTQRRRGESATIRQTTVFV